MPAIVAFRDTIADDPAAHTVLAMQDEVGAVYGLAYDGRRRHLYAAAYHRLGNSFGPGGPGQIYRVDLATGTVEWWATLPAGPDRHAPDPRNDPTTPSTYVGETSLGDIDLDDAGSVLSVMNLYDRRVVRLSVPDGGVIGSFSHGAYKEPWARNARPLGLGFHEHWLYHGIVDSRTFDTLPGSLSAHLYRSRLDGTAMAEVGGFTLDYPTMVWRSWATCSRCDNQPMFADIEFRSGGDLVIGLRDRMADTVQDSKGHDAIRQMPGDLLPGHWAADRIVVQVDPQHYMDTARGSWPNVTWGTLASWPGMEGMVAPIRGSGVSDVGALWFENVTGRAARSETVFDARRDPGWDREFFGLGDIEVLCPARDAVDPDMVATATREAGAIATATAQTATAAVVKNMTVYPATEAARQTRAAATAAAQATATVATATARAVKLAETATALAPTIAAAAPSRTAAATSALATARAIIPVLTVQAPTRTAMLTAASTRMAVGPAEATSVSATAAAVSQKLAGSCGSANPYFTVTQFMPSLDGAGVPFSDAERAAAPVVTAFNDTSPEDMSQHTALAFEAQLGAIFGAAWDHRRGQLYVAAYHKRLTAFGALGPGGIYRIDMNTGQVEPWGWLAAGEDRHAASNDFDAPSARWVGKVSLGDVELNTAGDTLLVTNLHDHLIYRLAVPSGAVLGAFPNGAIGEAWAADAWPFGLGVHGDWVYHAVVDGRGGSPAALAGMMAYVYRSRDDGTAMQEVVRVPLDYARQSAWSPWSDGGPRDPVALGAMLTDIEFRPDGDLVLGLRDRVADTGFPALGSIGKGDILALSWLGSHGFPLLNPSFYLDFTRHEDAAWGTLAHIDGYDQIVSTALDPLTTGPGDSGGAVWFDGELGNILRSEAIYEGLDFTFAKVTGLGDIELLCAPPTSTPSTSATPSPSTTPSPSATRRSTPTSSATSTATELRPTIPIYLPILDNRACRANRSYMDVVLVLDLSTSMQRTTRDGRTKIAAAIDAAHAFVTLLELAHDGQGPGDRVAVVGFNREAWTAIALSGSSRAVETALGALPARIAEGTRLDLAFEHGQSLLDSAGIGPNLRAMIVLTDGLPNNVPTPASGGSQTDTVLAAAAVAKSRGTRIFAVGLGEPDDLLRSLLAAAASGPEDFLYAPDAEDLAAIYRRIAGRIGACP